MKRIVAAMLLVVLFSAVAQAQGPVRSVNAVGYVKVSQAQGKFELMRADFDQIGGGTNVIGDVLDPTTLPSGAKVYLWDPVGQEYGETETIVTFPAPTRWSPGTNVLERGMAFWLKMPDTAPLSNEFSILGEVPEDGSASVVITPGFSFIAYPYPVEVLISDAGIPATSGDKVFYWDGTDWQSETYTTFPAPAKWTPGTYTFSYGKGFLYKSNAGTPQSWVVTQPYSLD